MTHYGFSVFCAGPRSRSSGKLKRCETASQASEAFPAELPLLVGGWAALGRRGWAVPGRRAAPGPMDGRWRSSGRGKGLSAGMCEYCRLQGRSAEMCRSLGHVVADTPVDALAHARGHGRPAGERCDACCNVHRSAVQCKELGHIPEQLEDADQPSASRQMP
jgi:hypothetical protein